uniref:TIGR02302 family protein n=1 Tax=Nereida sp. TaxID=2736090 RepID=UPI003F69B339
MTANLALPKATRKALWLTWLGLWSERITRAFWPVWSVVFVAVGAALLGIHEVLSEIAIAIAGVGFFLCTLAAIIPGIWQFERPKWAEAQTRLDKTLSGRPISSLLDAQAIGRTDPASQAVWDIHQNRMRAQAATAKAVEPDLRISLLDPCGLRFVALLVLSVGVLFGSFGQLSSVTKITQPADQLAIGPSWEGWVAPPAYTGRPTIYLPDVPAGPLRVPQGSEVTVRLYGELGALSVMQNVTRPQADPNAAEQRFVIEQSGALAIGAADQNATKADRAPQQWSVIMEPDQAPSIIASAPVRSEADGTLLQQFLAQDDYGVVAGSGVISLDLLNVDRAHGLLAEPENHPQIILQLPMTITGDRAQFEETLTENFSEHVFANLPVVLQMQVEDSLGQTGQSAPIKMTLPGRRFFDPLASAIIEQRRDLLWTRENATRVERLLRAISWLPDDIFRGEGTYLSLSFIIRDLASLGPQMSDQKRDEIAQALWELAIELEDGDLEDARQRLARAQERLNEAMRNGASQEEIAELMQDLRDASQDYLRQLAQEQQRNGEAGDQQQAGNNQEITPDQLQQMMDEIQQLMEEGRMAEAQERMAQLNQMLENMRVAQGSGEGGSQGEGQQAMEDLAETLRDQQDLSDEAFRQLQEQFEQSQQQGQQGQQQGQDGQQGEGAQQGNQSGQQEGQKPGGQSGGQGGAEGSGDLEGSLQNRQQALRQELDAQRRNLPGAGTQAGDDAREALGRAEGAMENADEALGEGDLAEAIDQQSRAIQALRDGLRDLGEAMVQANDGAPQEGQGRPSGQNGVASRDPLGRDRGQGRAIRDGEGLLQGDDA